jgi:hypothetical protein
VQNFTQKKRLKLSHIKKEIKIYKIVIYYKAYRGKKNVEEREQGEKNVKD